MLVHHGRSGSPKPRHCSIADFPMRPTFKWGSGESDSSMESTKRCRVNFSGFSAANSESLSSKIGGGSSAGLRDEWSNVKRVLRE